MSTITQPDAVSAAQLRREKILKTSQERMKRITGMNSSFKRDEDEAIDEKEKETQRVPVPEPERRNRNLETSSSSSKPSSARLMETSTRMLLLDQQSRWNMKVSRLKAIFSFVFAVIFLLYVLYSPYYTECIDYFLKKDGGSCYFGTLFLHSFLFFSIGELLILTSVSSLSNALWPDDMQKQIIGDDSDSSVYLVAYGVNMVYNVAIPLCRDLLLFIGVVFGLLYSIHFVPADVMDQLFNI